MTRHFLLYYAPTCLALVMAVASGMAQHYNLRTYTTRDGLVQNQVTALHQASDGRLWVGTKLGVSIFDGAAFENYNAQDNLVPGDISFICERSDNSIVLGGNRGLSLLRGDSISTYRKQVRNKHAFAFTQKGDSVFFLMRGQDKDRKNGKRYLFYGDTLRPCPDTTKYSDISYCPKQDFLIREKRGPGNLRTYILPDDTLIFNADTCKSEIQEVKWGCPIIRLNEKFYFPSGDEIYDLHGGELFVQKGCYFHYHKNTTLYEYSARWEILDTFHITGLNVFIIDQAGNYWFGTEQGLQFLGDKPFRHYLYKDMNIQGDIWNMQEGSKGEFYLGTYKAQFYKLKNGKVTEMHYPGQEDGNGFYYAKQRVGNTIYWGMKQGLMKYTPAGGFQAIHQEQIRAGLAVYFDKNRKRLYWGTKEGLVVTGIHGRIRQRLVKPQWKLSSITGIARDKNDALWLATRRGLARYHHKKINYYQDSIFEQGALAVLADHKRNLWFGGERGMIFYDGQGFQEIRSPNLDYKAITALHEVGDTLMLIGLTNGMLIMDLRRFYQDGQLVIRSFDAENGFVSNECQQNGFTPAQDGHIWIPTTDRLVKIAPAALHFAAKPARPLIKHVGLAQNMAWTDLDTSQLSLSHNENTLRFRFTSPCFSSQVHYTYRLVNYIDEWSAYSPDHKAEFKRLPPGRYIFQVKAESETHVPNPEVVSLAFTIAKPWYQKFWAKALGGGVLVLVSAGLVYAVMKRKMRRQKSQQEKQELELELYHNQLDPHFIFNTLQTSGSKALEYDNYEFYDILTKLSTVLRVHTRKAGRIVSLRDELELVRAYCELVKENMSGEFDFDIEKNGVALDQKVIKFSIQNFVENAVKHGLEPETGRSGLWLGITASYRKDESLCIRVEDNGKGFDPEKLKDQDKGTGLKNLETLFALYNKENKQAMTFKHYRRSQCSPGKKGICVELIIPKNYTFSYGK